MGPGHARLKYFLMAFVKLDCILGAAVAIAANRVNWIGVLAVEGVVKLLLLVAAHPDGLLILQPCYIVIALHLIEV